MVTHVRHPLVRHKLAKLRAEDTSSKVFRELVTEITQLMAYEALADLKLREVEVKTPLASAQCEVLADDLVVVPVLRAGMGMLDAVLQLVPSARVGFVGLYRDSVSKQAVEYYKKLPPDSSDAVHLLIDPMLATGGSTIAALDVLKEAGASRLIVACLVTCPEGLKAVEEAHPDVPIVAAAIDSHLDSNKYIVPGLGDAGDRLYNT